MGCKQSKQESEFKQEPEPKDSKKDEVKKSVARPVSSTSRSDQREMYRRPTYISSTQYSEPTPYNNYRGSSYASSAPTRSTHSSNGLSMDTNGDMRYNVGGGMNIISDGRISQSLGGGMHITYGGSNSKPALEYRHNLGGGMHITYGGGNSKPAFGFSF